MDYKLNKKQLFKKKINAPKEILDKIYEGSLTIEECINYNLKDKINVTSFQEKYRKIINIIGIDEALDLNWNFINDNFNWTTSMLEKYKFDYPTIMDYIYAMAYNDIVADRTRKVLYNSKVDIEFRKRFPQLFLNSKVDIDLQDKYYNYKLSIKDYINNIDSFENKYVAHTLYAGDYFKNIIKNITDESLNIFINNNKDLLNVIIDDESSVLNIISLYQDNSNKEDKKEIFRNFINLSNIDITSTSINILLNYFTMEEILANTNSVTKKFIKLYGLEKIEQLGISFKYLTNDMFLGFKSLGIDNIIEFDKNNNSYFKNSKYELVSDIYLNYHNDDSLDISDEIELFEDRMYRIFKTGNYYYYNVSDNFKNKYKDLFLDEEAPEELKELFYNGLLSGKQLHDNRNYIKYILNKNYKTGFKNTPIVIDNKEQDFYDYLINKMGYQSAYNLIADYGYTFDSVFESKIMNITSKDNLDDIIYNEIINEAKYNDELPAKFMINHKDLFLDIIAPEEFRNICYQKELTYNYLYENQDNIIYLKDKNLKAFFKNKYDIFDLFESNNTLFELIKAHGNTLENIKDSNSLDIILKIFNKKDDNIIELLFNDSVFLNKLLLYGKKDSVYKNYLDLFISNMSKKNKEMLININTSKAIYNNYIKENKNIELFGGIAKEAFDSFLEQNDNRFTPNFIQLFNNQNDTNYKNIEKYIVFYLCYKLNNLENIFREEFNDILTKNNKTGNDYVIIASYLKAIVSTKTKDIDMLDKYKYGCILLDEYLEKNNINKENRTSLIEKIVNDEYSSISLKYINDMKHFNYINNCTDIYNDLCDDSINRISARLIMNSNRNEFMEIRNLLASIGFNGYDLINITYNIYFTIGYEKAKEIIKKKYKKNKLINLFSYIDVNHLNENNNVLIDILFKENEYGSPITNYLDDFKELNKYIHNSVNEINNKTSNDYDKENSLSTLYEETDKYRNAVYDLLNKFCRLINESDIIFNNFSENYNIYDINELLNTVSKYRKPIIIDDRDELIVSSNHLNYIGYLNDKNKHYYEQLIYLSRKEFNTNKSIPYITFEYNDYVLKTMNPYDREIFNLSILNNNSYNIFNESLINIIKDTNKSIIYIEKNNTVIACCPIIRKGNILIIDGLLETVPSNEIMNSIVSILKEYSNNVINKANYYGDNIELILLENKNISCDLDTLTNKECFIVDDIVDNDIISQNILYKDKSYKYLDCEYLYTYPHTNKSFNTLELREKDITNIEELNNIKNTITELSNRRRKELKKKSAKAANTLTEIKELLDKYIIKYKILLDSTNNNIVDDYNKAMYYVNNINQILGKDIGDNKIKNFRYNKNWYIGITLNDSVVCASLPSGKNEYAKILKETLKYIESTLTEAEKKYKEKHSKKKGDK